MASPNALNPKFRGQVVGGSFEATHGDGVSVTAVACTGATAVYLFDSASASGCSFSGTVTGAWCVGLGATSQTVTLKGTSGATICAFTTGSTIPSIVGPNAALANTAIELSGSVSIVSTSNAGITDTSIVFVTYKSDES